MAHQMLQILLTRQATAILPAAMQATRAEALTSQATRVQMLRMLQTLQTRAATSQATLQTAHQTAANPFCTSFF